MTIPAKQQRACQGRYPRGEETKQRIIDAAIAAFGRHGYAGTSTRDIAAAAVVNTPAIQYYFGGKPGLYQACLDQLTAGVSRQITPAVDACRAVLASEAGLDEIIAALGQVQRCLIESFFSDHEGQAIRRLLAWEDAENDEPNSEPFMKERIGLPIFQTFRAAVERVAPVGTKPSELEMHALSLMGLSMIFHFNQSRCMDMLSWSLMDQGLLDALKDVAHRQLTFGLAGLAQTKG